MSNEKVVNVKTGKLENCTVGAGCKRHAHNIANLKPLDIDVESKYYLYEQNNSGGVFSEPAKNVLIQAKSAKEANRIAEANGVYFDEDYNIDCECCGTRWSKQDGKYNVYATKKEALDNVYVSDFDKEVPDFLIVEEK